jgi:hypothetical protein
MQEVSCLFIFRWERSVYGWESYVSPLLLLHFDRIDEVLYNRFKD